MHVHGSMYVCTHVHSCMHMHMRIWMLRPCRPEMHVGQPECVTAPTPSPKVAEADGKQGGVSVGGWSRAPAEGGSWRWECPQAYNILRWGRARLQAQLFGNQCTTPNRLPPLLLRAKRGCGLAGCPASWGRKSTLQGAQSLRLISEKLSSI